MVSCCHLVQRRELTITYTYRSNTQHLHTSAASSHANLCSLHFMNAGDFFGEIALTVSKQRTADVISLGTQGAGPNASNRPPEPVELFQLLRYVLCLPLSALSPLSHLSFSLSTSRVGMSRTFLAFMCMCVHACICMYVWQTQTNNKRDQ
jgi:hypothetical protein